MKLMIYVMNKPEHLDKFLKELAKQSIKGATIVSSTGMGRSLAGREDVPWLGSLKAILDMPRTESKVIMLALPDEQVDTVYQVIEQIGGDLSLPNTGIAFTLPIDSIKGYKG
jgi:nitrogen regulatory protein PII